MKYATDHAFRTALEARIKQTQSDSAGVSRLRKRIVFERTVIDVAFAAAPVQAPDQITTSSLLVFAGIDPTAVPAPPAEWATPWRRLVRDLPATDDIADGYRTAVALFGPVLEGTVTTGAWYPGVGWAP